MIKIDCSLLYPSSHLMDNHRWSFSVDCSKSSPGHFHTCMHLQKMQTVVVCICLPGFCIIHIGLPYSPPGSFARGWGWNRRSHQWRLIPLGSLPFSALPLLGEAVIRGVSCSLDPYPEENGGRNSLWSRVVVSLGKDEAALSSAQVQSSLQTRPWPHPSASPSLHHPFAPSEWKGCPCAKLADKGLA